MLSLTAANLTWDYHFHADNAPCAQVTVTVSVLNGTTGKTIQQSRQHAFRCPSVAGLTVNAALEQQIIANVQAALTHAGVDISNWAAVFTRTVDPNYPPGS